ncbi:RNA polymerase II C-terminal domain phosphatase-like 1 isoform X3 [Cryptomeria japonica]|uniref:RNA polymerase II C-terminal domain phosphatase-like 1 isoform X3 n=1 Tax=Cryptomeria japonica TaxID=3369 RepID=UPI0025AD87FC|nr:RNA polymerase II C-terminal domain phosphatase-like 1 isoform X3 [Cryptomeria japonica]
MACEKLSSKLYHGDTYVGEVCIYPQYEDAYLMSIISKEIRISEFSSQSKRCSPLVVLHSIASNGVCFKMELKEQQSQLDHSNLISLHKSCLIEAKTAMITLGENELHLVAMLSEDRHDQVPCFWGFNVVSGLYGSCLGMLNLRCLAIVFDLDETLIVANTMRSFEDRIEALRRKILGEVDPQRVAGLSAEIKRYQQDQKILKQFCENDEVCDNGKLFKAQSEIAPAPSDNHLPLIRPIIRLHERNVILTRINPNIRDTSVLVRVRPAWEELRNYLIANGRKRFEVFVCTMSEKDYALEMWRLLDPETSLISPRELHDRVVCVKPGLRKSLVNVFHKGICHPKITMVIDDRLKVWEDTDQSHVHVVPAFAPYYAPLAEQTNVPLPILCVARNVACNVRGGFFKDFDEGHIQKMDEVVYETDVTKLSATPDVSNYLLTEAKAAANGNANLAVLNGTANSEIEKKLDLQVFGGDDELKRGYMQRDYSSLSGNHTSKPSSVNSGGFCNGKNGSGEKQSRDLQNAVSCKPMEADIPIASTSEQSKRVDPDCMTWSTEKISHEKDGDQPSLETQDSTGFVRLPCAGDPQSAGISAQATCFEQRSDDNGNVTHDPVNALKELCTKEGLSFHFRNQPLNGALNVMDSHAQVEVAGQILGKSNSPVLEAAKLQAAEEALKNLKASIINQQSQKRLNSNRMSPDQPNKRIKQEEFLEVGP